MRRASSRDHPASALPIWWEGRSAPRLQPLLVGGALRAATSTARPRSKPSGLSPSPIPHPVPQLQLVDLRPGLGDVARPDLAGDEPGAAFEKP